MDSEIAFAPEDYALPVRIDSAAHYLFYLHGKIVEDQGLPAVSEEFGEYRYAAILEALKGYGFVVISELRPRDADPDEAASRLTGQIETLMNAGVPPGSIAVVGASKGAAIAVLASNRLADADLSYVLLGSCHPAMLQEWAARGSPSPAMCWRYAMSPTWSPPAHARPSSRRPMEGGWAATRNSCFRWGLVTGSSMRLWPNGWSRPCAGRIRRGEGRSAQALHRHGPNTGSEMPAGVSHLTPGSPDCQRTKMP